MMGMDQKWSKSRNLGESFGHAWEGVVGIMARERNLRIILVAFIFAIFVGVILGISRLEFVLIIFVSAAIMAAEMLNAALEALSNIVSPEYREGVKQSKDLAAGAVLVLSLAAIVIGLLIFLPYTYPHV